MRLTVFAALLCAAFAPGPALADGPDLDAIVDQHILPGFALLARETEALATLGCEDPALRPAYHTAFDAWVAVSHLRFGPSEDEARAFALAYWPDPRGATPKALAALLDDPITGDAAGFATVSIAARGFYALEFLLYDPQFARAETCPLIRAVTRDMAATAGAIHEGWQSYGAVLRAPGNDTYRDADEAARQLYTALTTGLAFTQDMRLGRPLGSYDRPRPKRAEAWRSGRSLAHVVLSLQATRALAALLSDHDARILARFDAALTAARALQDPVFAGVATPISRIRVEALQQDLRDIAQRLQAELGPRLGVVAGFNALDGD
jgi:predicted lipoprotein